MTFSEAAIKILRDNKNLPMSSKDIWSEIEKIGLIKTNGKTPWATLNAILICSDINSNSKYKVKNSERLMFESIGKNPMKFRLLNLNESDVPIINEEQNIGTELLLYEITCKEINWKKLSFYNNNENLEYRISNCDEFTYIIEDKHHPSLKIGKTTNDPEQRLSNLKTGNPSISLYHVFPSSLYTEKELHEKFQDYKKDLEWFWPTNGLTYFLSEEIEKHKEILNSYNKKKELDNLEKVVMNLLK